MSEHSINNSTQQNDKESVHLEDLSFPPSEEQLSHFAPTDPSSLPAKYRRSVEERVFVNRNVHLTKIEYFGFDMDYTLAVYKEPEFETLVYGLAVDKLLKKGYPESIRKLQYDPDFPQRGLFLDIKRGNLLKVDMFGSILMCVHGHHALDKKTMQHEYPDMIVHPEDIGGRYHLFNTLFGLAEICLYADLVNLFEHEYHASQENIEGEFDLSFENLFTDLRGAIDEAHADSSLKMSVINNFEKYLHKDPRMPHLLKTIRQRGRKVFLMTNSEFYYTNEVMGYLLNGVDDEYPNWKDYFDIVIVSAKKPRFFEQGTALREVELETGQLKLGKIRSFKPGKVYSGGNLETFRKLTGTQGHEVLYIGDNIYHDIIRSKKSRCLWKTLLVLRELGHELDSWRKGHDEYKKLLNLEYIRAETYRGLDSRTDTPPQIDALKDNVERCVTDLDRSFNPFFGSLFRSGSKTSFFSFQVQRYSDLYAADYLNLINYPLFYLFSPEAKLLPHEEEALENISFNA
eukprot:gb/GECH01013600.1/.p1 GENE.gb/GECH01013600.1/~~gb/GECH01013600.1/.p1  ORF type:complete len:514 (+),score=137.57 gb/GECH01013600.1/:1-1542(+)